MFREDFLTERKDREAAHTQRNELEERYKTETNNLKEQLQRVGADNGRLTQQMERERASLQQQLAEKNKHVQDLVTDKHTLQVGMRFSAGGMEKGEYRIAENFSEVFNLAIGEFGKGRQYRLLHACLWR